ncbi:hypothetical protein [Pseudomonas sp. MF4836]|uniref:hypothetical protein n=1 Tax=Pseudomonas sp. MF4836 TaxID=1960827 RepID=UPI001EE6D9A0|nr:hypothetical protein [Pseudomonas sp. MF4836]
MCKWIKAFSLIFILPSVLLINGCHLIAQSRWEGRDVQEALDLFGKPDSMQKQNGAGGETLVLLTWYKSSSWTTTEAAGTSMNHTGNGMVYTEYYPTVGTALIANLRRPSIKPKKSYCSESRTDESCMANV